MSRVKTLSSLPLSLIFVTTGLIANDSRPIYLNNILPIMQGSGLSAPKPSLLNNTEADQNWIFLVSANLQSHANDAGSDTEFLIIDGEVQQLSFLSEWNFAPRWQIGVGINVVKNSAGNFDNAIREWHDLFGLDQGDRENLIDDQFLYSYRNDENPSKEIIVRDSVSSISDTEISLAYQLYQKKGLSIAAYLGAMIPTGDVDKVTGSNKTDVKLALALGLQTHKSLSWHLHTELIAIGDQELFNISTNNNTWAASAGMHWRPNDYWRWSMQLDGHGEVFNSTIEEINQPAWQLALASQYKQWQVYFAEDLSVNRAADFSFGINWLSAY